jgi:hypothetical protein
MGSAGCHIALRAAMIFIEMNRFDPLSLAGRFAALVVVVLAALWAWSYISMETLSIRAFGRGWDLTCLRGVIYTDLPPLQIDEIDIGLSRKPADNEWFTKKYTDASHLLGFAYASPRPGMYLVGVPIWPAFGVAAGAGWLVFRSRRRAIARDALARAASAATPR